MRRGKSKYDRHRFPPEVISHAVGLYHPFTPSFRVAEDLLAERGVEVSYESIRRWCLKFGPRYQRTLKRRERQLGEDWFIDEVFVSIAYQQHYLWRAVNQDGELLDIFVQRRRNRAAAERFFREVLASQGREPRRAITDGLYSNPPAIRKVLPSAVHDTSKYANNRAENSHQYIRRREQLTEILLNLG